ncbi:olfactory receptor 1019 [Xenopus laevis]|uniref:Olfactory receptor n=2 Tax=Xenopus laevis TaxID=8355 RepID=A0A974C7E2_XENLA|nr:olfactory receptor 1019 [Xenopus laevis]OCT67958.1 hypothetical protein XELAEV_18039256mg [Xenopus laevis]
MNRTWVNNFIIKGITDIPELQAPIFMLVLAIYFIIITGNSIIFYLICVDPRLHNPMYFFLSNLSVLDMCYTTVTMHEVLVSYVSGRKSVSFSGCIAQMYFCVSFLCCEFLLLTAMSYDRFLAICNPLHYLIIMSNKMCVKLMSACWILGFLIVVPVISLIFEISCFQSNEINHFFCDLLALMKLLCSSAFTMEHLLYIQSIFIGFVPLSLTVLSYVSIIRTIFKVQSSGGRLKAFYTCSSHLTVVFILYVTIFCLYMRPAPTFNLDSDKFISLLYTTLTPMLNPIIYSLKNKDVKAAFKKCVQKRVQFRKSVVFVAR